MMFRLGGSRGVRGAHFSLLVRRWGWTSLGKNVPLSAEKYNVKRGQFAEVTALDVEHFRSVVGASNVLQDPHEVEPYNVDWLMTSRGQSQVVVRPGNAEEVSKVLRHCNQNNLAVVPQGGNTGLVGGSIPVFDEVIMSLGRMNKIISINEASGVLTCDAGCVLEYLDGQVRDKGFMMPLDLGAKGSCHIGGNAATNAGGLRLLRYGSLHGSVLGLEAVLADGTIMDCLSEMRKDNTGYDMKQLFIGSEGTLGIITKLNVLLATKPQAVNVAFLGVESFQNVQEVYRKAREMLGEILSACEFLEHDCLELVIRNVGGEQPISQLPFYMLIETSGSNQKHDEEKLSSFLESVMNDGLVPDGTVATDGGKLQALWALREGIAEAVRHEGTSYHYDVSLPLENYYKVVECLKERLTGKATKVVGYGHIGDCNIHVNVTSDGFSREVLNLIEPFIFDYAAQHGGSVSAEHGIGIQKPQYVYHSKSREAVEMMRRVKKIFDPKGILNPYKTIPES